MEKLFGGAGGRTDRTDREGEIHLQIRTAGVGDVKLCFEPQQTIYEKHQMEDRTVSNPGKEAMSFV